MITSLRRIWKSGFEESLQTDSRFTGKPAPESETVKKLSANSLKFPARAIGQGVSLERKMGTKDSLNFEFQGVFSEF
jgi:hypothetical protein